MIGGHTATARLLLEGGADPNRIDKQGGSTLVAAALQGKAEIVNLLVEGGASVNMKAGIDGNHATALLVAAFNGKHNMVELLLQVSLSLSLCMRLKGLFLNTVLILFHEEWCIRVFFYHTL